MSDTTIQVKIGSTIVKIRRAPRWTAGKLYDSWLVEYYDLNGQRIRLRRPTLKKARALAQERATKLSRGQAIVLTLTPQDCASYTRARELLAPIGTPIEIAAAEYAQAKQMLGQVAILDAIRDYLTRHPADLPAKTVREVVDELTQIKEQDGKSARYTDDLKSRLPRFAQDFTGPISAVSGVAVDEWLRLLKKENGSAISLRTRKNYRNALMTLFNFAKARRYLPADWSEFDAVQPIDADDEGEIEIFSPEELLGLLAEAERSRAARSILPFLVIGAFAGLRSAEIERLDWSKVDFNSGFITVGKKTAKTRSRRLVPILPNLREWLLPYAQRFGPVCKLSKSLPRMALRAGVPWKHNALRHSFISYRLAALQNVNQVALEAGNSPNIIFRDYRELVTPTQAESWFSIVAQRGNVVSVPAAAAV